MEAAIRSAASALKTSVQKQDAIIGEMTKKYHLPKAEVVAEYTTDVADIEKLKIAVGKVQKISALLLEVSKAAGMYANPSGAKSAAQLLAACEKKVAESQKLKASGGSERGGSGGSKRG